MAYNSFFPQGYQPYQVSNQFPNQNQQMQRSGIIWVSGEAGAKAYLVAPNTSVVLFDSESDVIYVKSADASGLPNMRILDYTMRDASPQGKEFSPVGAYASKEDVDYLKAEIESLKAKFEVKEGSKK